MEEQLKYITYNKYTDELTAIPISDDEAYTYENVTFCKRDRPYFISRGIYTPLAIIKNTLAYIQTEIDSRNSHIDNLYKIQQLDESQALKDLVWHIRYACRSFTHSDTIVFLIQNYIKEKFDIDVTS